MKLLLIGAGRMARSVAEVVARDPAVSIVGVVARSGLGSGFPTEPRIARSLEEALGWGGSPIVIDLSGAEGAADRIAAMASAKVPLVEGTTGLDAAAEKALLAAARAIPIVRAPNLSPGIVLLRRALAAIASAQGPAWDAAVVDRHPRAKKDAPSGTARLLIEDLRRHGIERVPVSSFRQGGVVGEHAVYLTGADEEIVLTHRAFDRRAFAAGAVLAARFLAVSKPGLFGMEDVLGAGDFSR